MSLQNLLEQNFWLQKIDRELDNNGVAKNKVALKIQLKIIIQLNITTNGKQRKT